MIGLGTLVRLTGVDDQRGEYDHLAQSEGSAHGDAMHEHEGIRYCFVTYRNSEVER